MDEIEYLCCDCGTYVVSPDQWDPEAYDEPEKVEESIKGLGYISAEQVTVGENVECAGCGYSDYGTWYRIH